MTYEKSNFRITKSELGFLVEIQKTKWTLFGLKKYWANYLTYSGVPLEPYYFVNFNSAIEQTLKEIRWEILANFEN